MVFSGIFRSLIDIGRSLILIEFSKILMLADLSGVFRF